MRLISFFVIVFVSSICNASTWVSPIDKKYQTSFPELYKKYDNARKALDKHRGRREQLIEAKKSLDEVLIKEGAFAPAYREYARLFMKAGHTGLGNFQAGVLGSAEAALLEAIRIEPEYADAYVLLGHLYTNTESYAKAEGSLKRAEKIGTELPWFHLNYADLLKDLGRLDEALPHYMSVINSDTDNRNAYSYALLGAALHYKVKGNFAESEKWFIKYTSYDQSAWGWGEYTRFLIFSVGNTDKAIETGEKALSIMQYGLGRLNLACAYYAKWAELVEHDSTSAQIYFDKASALIEDKNRVVRKMSQYNTTRMAAMKLAKKLDEQKRGV